MKSVLILLVAGMIAGGFYFLVTRSRAFSAMQENSAFRFERHSRLNNPGETPARPSLWGSREREFDDRGFEGRQSRNGNPIAWLEITRNLGLIALITFFVAGFQWVFKRLRRRPAQ